VSSFRFLRSVVDNISDWHMVSLNEAKVRFICLGAKSTVVNVVSETTLSVKGQIVIPLRVRGKLGLNAGQKFEVEAMSDGTILLIPIPNEVIDAMRLPAAERLERALSEERRKEEQRHEVLVRELRSRCESS